MIKVLKISGFYLGKDKFDNMTYQIDGIAYERRNNYHGNFTKRVWIRDNLVQLADSSIGKDLYCEYNERGWVTKVEVK